MSGSNIALLEAEARFHRERLALYRARRYGSRPTSETRFRELQRASSLADGRLQLAREHEPASDDLRSGNDRRQVEADILQSEDRRHPSGDLRADHGGQRRT